MASIGKIDTFDQNQETFPRYVQRVKNFFLANGIEEERRKYVFLNSLGRKHYNILANLLGPADPESKSFDEAVEALTVHLSQNLPLFQNVTLFIAVARNHMKA